MRRALFTLILLFCVADGHAEVLKVDAVWSGDRTVTESVRVEPGVHLVIEEGSRITFVGGRLEVAGRLTARGAELTGSGWDGLVLKGTGPETLVAACRIAGARTGVQVIGGAPRLEELILAGNDIGIEFRQQSEGTLAGSTVRDNRKVGLFVKDGAAPAIVNNRFESNGRYGAYVFRATPRRFAGNVFSGHETALMVAYSGSEPELRDNCFEQNGVAIRVEKAARPLITGSDISRNETGISLYRRADPVITGNRLAANGTGIAVAFSSYPEIRRNDFVANGRAIALEFQSSEWERKKGAAARQVESGRSAFGSLDKGATELPPPRRLDGSVDARENWWGEAGTDELTRIGPGGNPTFIDDGRDQPTFVEEGATYPLDTVDFGAWLDAAVFPDGGKP